MVHKLVRIVRIYIIRASLCVCVCIVYTVVVHATYNNATDIHTIQRIVCQPPFVTHTQTQRNAKYKHTRSTIDIGIQKKRCRHFHCIVPFPVSTLCYAIHKAAHNIHTINTPLQCANALLTQMCVCVCCSVCCVCIYTSMAYIHKYNTHEIHPKTEPHIRHIRQREPKSASFVLRFE